MSGKREAVTRQVVADVVELFGANFSLTLEGYFTQLESMIGATRFTPPGESTLTRADLVKKRENLMAALAAVLEASTDEPIEAGGCTHHRRLVEHLEPHDTVVSFNYDCVIDRTLRDAGSGRWSARWGYGFAKPSRIDDVGVAYWSPRAPARHAKDTVYLLKPHGSLNWQLPPTGDGPVVLKQRLHRQRGTPRFTIIPPSTGKNEAGNPIFDDLWMKVERALRYARSIAVVGFSFTPTDLHVEAVVRLALARNKSLRTLTIANPSRDARERIRHVFSRALAPRSGAAGTPIVRQYESFEQFVGALPDALA